MCLCVHEYICTVFTIKTHIFMNLDNPLFSRSMPMLALYYLRISLNLQSYLEWNKYQLMPWFQKRPMCSFRTQSRHRRLTCPCLMPSWKRWVKFFYLFHLDTSFLPVYVSFLFCFVVIVILLCTNYARMLWSALVIIMLFVNLNISNIWWNTIPNWTGCTIYFTGCFDTFPAMRMF